MKIKQAILDYIKVNNQVTYIEIQEIMTQYGFDWQGDFVLCSGKNRNVIFWDGWSKAAVDLLNEIEGSGEIEAEPCSPLYYVMGGATLSLPIVRGRYYYKTPHWLPIRFNHCQGRAQV